MLIYPAIDLRQGKCVRLQQGARSKEKIYSADPIATAESFLAQGAAWLHVIDLDGAFAEKSSNRAIIKKMANTLSGRIQCGGGIRSLDDIVELLEAGVARVILGTLAVHHPKLVKLAVEKFGADAIAVAIDARDGRVAAEGWKKNSSVNAIEFAHQLEAHGVELVIHTDIARDGMLSGVNLPAIQKLLEQTHLRLIASGGVRDLRDLLLLHALNCPRLDGVIIGRALYEGTIQLADAIKIYKNAFVNYPGDSANPDTKTS
jgi:phosphoribosylformimino-5-aminoimidazole carboxamide ribotide isomerase